MKRVVIALLLIFWAGTIAAWPSLPERIPIHYDLRGQPDGWASSLVGWFLLPVVATAMVVFFQLLTRMATYTPEYWNVPEKQRFLALTPEQRRPIIEVMVGVLHVAGIYSLVLLMVIQASSYWTAERQGTGLGPVFYTVLFGGMLVLFVYALSLRRRVRDMIMAAGESANMHPVS